MAPFVYFAFEKDSVVVAFEWITAGRVHIHAGPHLIAFKYEPVAQSAHAAENLDYPCALDRVWDRGCTSLVTVSPSLTAKPTSNPGGCLRKSRISLFVFNVNHRCGHRIP